MNTEQCVQRTVESAFTALSKGQKVDVSISISNDRVGIDDYSLAKIDKPVPAEIDLLGATSMEGTTFRGGGEVTFGDETHAPGIAVPVAKSSFEAMIGRTAREKLTTIQGRIIAVTIWETGCNHIGIKRLGLDKDGKPHEVLWFDEGNVELIGEIDESLSPKTTDKPGGPVPNGR